MNYGKPSNPAQDTFSDFRPESNDEDNDEIEVPDGVEENLPAGYSQDIEENNQ